MVSFSLSTRFSAPDGQDSLAAAASNRQQQQQASAPPLPQTLDWTGVYLNGQSCVKIPSRSLLLDDCAALT